MTTEKIAVNRDSEIEDILDIIGETESQTITLIVPKNSKLSENRNNFSRLNQKARVLGKELKIESVDEKVITLAENSGMETENPLFASKRRLVADIIMPVRAARNPYGRGHFQKIAPRRLHWAKYRKWGIVAVIVLILLAPVAFGLYRYFPRADISVKLKVFPWSYRDKIGVASAVKNIDTDNARIPGVIFSDTGNLTLAFPASSRKNIEQKAAGRIIIYNAYGFSPQVLVATTRFRTADGKIYRLVERAIVPGAKIEGGKIIPSSIEAMVAADKAGADYNSPPVDHLSIPGFEGTDKFDKFYGKFPDPITGGFKGDAGFGTANDLIRASEKITAALRDSIMSALALELPNDFKTLTDAVKFDIGKITSTRIADASGNFYVSASGKLSVFGFREQDLRNLLLAMAQKQLGFAPRARDQKLEYDVSRLDFSRSVMDLDANFSADFVNDLDLKKFVGDIRGREQDNFKMYLLSVPGIDHVEITLSPFWVKYIPKNTKNITVNVN